ncbi:MAG: hypothetical protein II661_03385 [Bacteroidales bacterium]|nr:hypothetical protein [Bacteroidales bacterium]
MDRNEVYKALVPYLSRYGNGPFGASLLDQWRNANSAIGALGELEDVEDRELWESALNSQKAQAVAGSVLAGLGGAAQIYGMANDLSQIADTSVQEGQIANKAAIGTRDYSNNYQLMSAYDSLGNYQPDLSLDTLRGTTEQERIGGALSAGLAGAGAGMTIGGPWGAAIGFGVGTLGGILGNVANKTNAKWAQKGLQTDNLIADNYAVRNLGAQGDNLADAQSRLYKAHSMAEGGKMTTLEDFAKRVQQKQKDNSVTRSAGIVRTYCKGGVRIRIKR